MPNLLFLSSSELFAEDFKEQLDLVAPDFDFYTQYQDDVVFDVVIIDKSQAVPPLLAETNNIPLIFLGNETDEIPDSALVINKPCKLENLLDSVLSCINFSSRGANAQINFGNYTLDSFHKQLINNKNDSATKLTEREIAIISYLYKTKGKTVSKAELLSEVWEYNPEATTHTVETHIYRLRQKIDADNQGENPILTEENGYSLQF